MKLIRVIAIFFSFFFLFTAQKRNRKILLYIDWRKIIAGHFLKAYPKNNYHPADTLSGLKNKVGGYCKHLGEIRLLVIPDYQDYPENKWVNELKQKDPVTINKKVLSQIL